MSRPPSPKPAVSSRCSLPRGSPRSLRRAASSSTGGAGRSPVDSGSTSSGCRTHSVRHPSMWRNRLTHASGRTGRAGHSHGRTATAPQQMTRACRRRYRCGRHLGARTGAGRGDRGGEGRHEIGVDGDEVRALLRRRAAGELETVRLVATVSGLLGNLPAVLACHSRCLPERGQVCLRGSRHPATDAVPAPWREGMKIPFQMAGPCLLPAHARMRKADRTCPSIG